MGTVDRVEEFVRDNAVDVGWSVGVIVIVFALRYLLLRALSPRLDSAEARFLFRKTSLYVSSAIAMVGLVAIWISQLGSIGSFIGILSAGVAIALSDVLKNLAGWAYIVIRRPFKPGDRIEIGEYAGDVIDIPVQHSGDSELG